MTRSPFDLTEFVGDITVPSGSNSSTLQNTANVQAIVNSSAPVVYNVKAFGSNVGNGGDDTNGFVNAFTEANGVPGIIWTPPGNYNVDVSALAITGNGVTWAGAGRQASIINKVGNGLLLDISGTGTGVANHVRYGGVQGLGFNGNNHTGLMFRTYYTDNFIFRDNFFTGNLDTTWDSAEFWDSRVLFNAWENCGGAVNGTNTPNLWLRNSAASVGFGLSTDSVNQIHLIGNRFEGFTNGAVSIQHGPGNTSNENGIYMYSNKMETSSIVSSSHLLVDASATDVVVDGLYCYAGASVAGFSAPITVINWQTAGSSSLRNVEISNSLQSTIQYGVSCFATGTNFLENIWGSYGTAPTGSHLTFPATGAGTVYLINTPTNKGTQYTGTAPSGLVNGPTWQSISV